MQPQLNFSLSSSTLLPNIIFMPTMVSRPVRDLAGAVLVTVRVGLLQ